MVGITVKQNTWMDATCQTDEVTPFRKLMHPYILLLRAVGLNYSAVCESKSWIKALFDTFSIILGLGAFSFGAYMLTYWETFYHMPNTPHATITMTMTVWIFQASVATSFLAWWKRKNYFEKFDMLLTEASGQAGVEKDCGYYRRWVHGTLGVAALFWLVQVVFVGLSLFMKPVWMPVFDYFYYMDTGMKIISFFLIAYCPISWGLTMLFCMHCNAYIVSEFNYMADSIQNEQKLTAHFISTASKIHAKLLSAVNHADRMFSYYILTQYMGAIPLLVVLGYNLVTAPPGNRMMVGMMLFWFLAGAFELYALSSKAAHVNQAASKPKEILLCRMSTTDAIPCEQAELYRAATWFTQQSDTHTGISLGGFVIITKSILLTIASLVFTYITLLLELQPAELCDCSNGNITARS